jgi:hypothetical protein
MKAVHGFNRRQIIAGVAGLLAAQAIVGRAKAETHGVTDTEIAIWHCHINFRRTA